MNSDLAFFFKIVSAASPFALIVGGLVGYAQREPAPPPAAQVIVSTVTASPQTVTVPPQTVVLTPKPAPRETIVVTEVVKPVETTTRTKMRSVQHAPSVTPTKASKETTESSTTKSKSKSSEDDEDDEDD